MLIKHNLRCRKLYLLLAFGFGSIPSSHNLSASFKPDHMLNLSEETLLSVSRLLCSMLWSLWCKAILSCLVLCFSAVCSNPWLVLFFTLLHLSVFLYLSCNLFQFPFNQSCACIWCDCVMWLAWCWWCHHPHWRAEGKHSGPAPSSHV